MNLQLGNILLGCRCSPLLFLAFAFFSQPIPLQASEIIVYIDRISISTDGLEKYRGNLRNALTLKFKNANVNLNRYWDEIIRLEKEKADYGGDTKPWKNWMEEYITHLKTSHLITVHLEEVESSVLIAFKIEELDVEEGISKKKKKRLRYGTITSSLKRQSLNNFFGTLAENAYSFVEGGNIKKTVFTWCLRNPRLRCGPC